MVLAGTAPLDAMSTTGAPMIFSPSNAGAGSGRGAGAGVGRAAGAGRGAAGSGGGAPGTGAAGTAAAGLSEAGLRSAVPQVTQKRYSGGFEVRHSAQIAGGRVALGPTGEPGALAFAEAGRGGAGCGRDGATAGRAAAGGGGGSAAAAGRAGAWPPLACSAGSTFENENTGADGRGRRPADGGPEGELSRDVGDAESSAGGGGAAGGAIAAGSSTLGIPLGGVGATPRCWRSRRPQS